jgi:hypothetical protein
MDDTNLEHRIRDFVSDKADLQDLTLEIDLLTGKYGLYGDDVWDLMQKFSDEFQVELKDFRWYHHSGPEGCNPLWIFFKPWWTKKTHVPTTLNDLIQSARSGKWTVQYPDNEREPES